MAMQVRAVIVAAFEPDGGPVPGELSHWIERERLTERLPLAAGYRPLWTDGDGILAIAVGVGAARAAASIMALGLDDRFDLTQAYWLVTGVAGINPAEGSLASVVLPEFIVDGDLTHEIDAREIPEDWPDGFVPIGKTVPYEWPRADRFDGDDGIRFRLKLDFLLPLWPAVVKVALQDTEAMAARRIQFSPAETAHRPPFTLRGDELSSTTFWHGRRMSKRATRWIDYQTHGQATYAITAMEDTGILGALRGLAAAQRVDFGRILIVRAASNFDQQRDGISAGESLAETKVVSYSAYRPALENAWRVGSFLLRSLLG